VQGATEFLPVSSSGHLALGRHLLHVDAFAASPLLMDIALHLATLAAVVFVYRKDVAALLKGAVRIGAAIPAGQSARVFRTDESARLLVFILLATIPTGFIGIAMEQTGVAAAVGDHPHWLGAAFITGAIILLSSRFAAREPADMTALTALLIGVAQGIAVLPGISRSGTTIAVALLLKVARPDAARFSFLLSIPAILGAALLECSPAALFDNPATGPLLAGAAVAFATGIAALLLLIRLVNNGRFWLFAPYVAAVGCAAIFFL
jgi:undecaprenyl-diphosphatase